MKREKRRIRWGAAAVVVALAAGACARDANAPGVRVPTDAGPPSAALSDGALVRAQVRDQAELPRGDGVSALHEIAVGTREAVVVGGAAKDAASGMLLALGPGHDGGHRDLRHADGEGRHHRLVLDGPPVGEGPPTTVRYERDGELVAQVDYRWERRGGGYVLRERTVTLHRQGRVLLRQVRRIDGVEIAAGVPAADAPAADAAPRLWRAQVVGGCLREWAVYIGASATMIVAGEVYTILPNPATGAALVTAIGAWEESLRALLLCQANQTLSL